MIMENQIVFKVQWYKIIMIKYYLKSYSSMDPGNLPRWRLSTLTSPLYISLLHSTSVCTTNEWLAKAFLWLPGSIELLAWCWRIMQFTCDCNHSLALAGIIHSGNAVFVFLHLLCNLNWYKRRVWRLNSTLFILNP